MRKFIPKAWIIYATIISISTFSYTPISYADNDLNSQLMLMNSYNVAKHDDIWARLRTGFKLNHDQNKLVHYYEKFYTKNPKSFLKLMTNAKPYIYYLLVEVERYGLPSELALLPAVESSYNPNAYTGMWQFIGLTGRRFNLNVSDDVDERQNVIRSTQAAMIYLSYLNRLFKQWEPAIGAYNCGEGCMYKAIINSGQILGKVDYSELKLPKVTENYLPKLIALANIMENPKKFGVSLPDEPNTPYFAITYPQAGNTLSQVEKLSNTPLPVFNKLNPQYKDGSYELSSNDRVLLPVNNQSMYYASINRPTLLAKATPTQITQDQNKLDDMISQVIAANQADLGNNDEVIDNAQLATNSTTNTDESAPSANALDGIIANLDQGDQPSTPAKVAKPATPTIVAVNPQDQDLYYTVKEGDTLYSIAKAHNVDVDIIRKINQIPGNNLVVGQTLVLRDLKSNTLHTF